MSSNFVHLRNHSHFSLLRGVPSPLDWVRQAKLMGFTSLAMTDTNHTGGLILFLEECKKLGVKPILGVHLMNEHHPQDAMTLLALNMLGYEELCEVTSQYMMHHREDETFSIAKLLLDPSGEPRDLENLVVMSHSQETLEAICQMRTKVGNKANVKTGNKANVKTGNKANVKVDNKASINTNNTTLNLKIYAELIAQSPESRARSKELMRWARAEGIPLVATNANYFLVPEDQEIQRVMRAIDCNASLQQLASDEVAPSGAWMKSSQQMWDIFASVPEALINSVEIANLVVDDWEQQEWLMPRIEVPDGFTDDEYLRHCALQGLDKNYPEAIPEKMGDAANVDQLTHVDDIDDVNDIVQARHREVAELAVKNRPQARDIQERELEIICNKGYSSYFLMVKQIRDWANEFFQERYRKPRDCSVLRGSAANSITLYNLGASDLDPIRYGLYFERFLNEDRVSPPDADLDFGWDERDQVLEYIIEHFGEERCAMMCTTNTFRWRSAVREVAKVYGYTDDQITRLMKEWKSESRDAAADRRRGDPNLSKILDFASQLEGKPRFLGQHCGGILISNQPITRHVSCQYSGGVKNRKITQIDMHNGIDYLGLIKFDILGNGSTFGTS